MLIILITCIITIFPVVYSDTTTTTAAQVNEGANKTSMF